MDCPKCHSTGALRVVATEHRSNGTHRYRRCLHCSYRLHTCEVPFSSKPGPAPGTQLGVRKAPGSRNGNAVLTENDVLRLRAQSSMGIPNYRLASEYGLAPATVSRIINRKAWTHI